MLLNWINRIVAAPLASALFALALAVIAGQLYALGTLAQGQVQKAQLRDSLQTTANRQQASCFLNNRGAALSACRPSASLAMAP